MKRLVMQFNYKLSLYKTVVMPVAALEIFSISADFSSSLKDLIGRTSPQIARKSRLFDCGCEEAFKQVQDIPIPSLFWDGKKMVGTHYFVAKE